jgi:uncharacterized membrane protein YkoI
MNVKHTIAITLAAVALGFPWLGTGYAASHQGTQDPAYTSSIHVKDQDREARGERHEERGEATQLASLAKIDLTQAMSAALSQVPGTVLNAALDNEDGNLVYSVEIITGPNEVKDVKVDAGNGTVLHVDVGGQGEDEDDD